MGYHLIEEGASGFRPEDIKVMGSERLAEVIVEASDDDDKRNRIYRSLVRFGNEFQLVPLLKFPLERVRRFASCALWSIWMHEKGAEAYSELSMGISALERRNYDEALRLFQNTLTRYPNWTEAMNKVATTLYLMGCPRDSVAFCREVLKRKPHHFGAWHGLILCAIKLQDWQTAREAVRRFRELIPFSPEIEDFNEILENASRDSAHS